MRVAHIVPSFHPAYIYGGPIQSVHEMCRHLAVSRCEVRVLTTDANGPDRVLNVEKDQEVELAERLRVRYCQRRFLHTVSCTFLKRLPSYVQWSDVVHLTAVYSFPTIPTLLACQRFDKPVVWSPRGALQRWEGTTHVWQKALWEQVCWLVAPTRLVLHVTSEDEARASLRRLPGIKVVVIPNGIEIPEKISHVHGHGVLRLLYLGRLHPIKGIDNLLAACTILKNSHCAFTWRLTIAGTGDRRYTESLMARIEELALASQVRMIGEVRSLEGQKRFLRDKAGIPPDLPVVLWCGKFVEQKCPFDLLKAFVLLSEHCKASLVFVGDGTLRNAMEAFVAERQLENVYFFGFRNQTELPACYALADVFVLPSSFEPWGLVLNEAMCFGLPVIASDQVGAAADLVQQGRNGFVYPVGNVQALAHRLQEVLADERIRQEMGRQSQVIISRWGIEEDVEGVLMALHTVAGKRM